MSRARTAVRRARLALLLWMGGLGALPAVAGAYLQYTALGDSYASGVGTREYRIDDGRCKRSEYAYPWQFKLRTGVGLVFSACSGAETQDVIRDQVRHVAFSDLVTVSVGGNDANFSGVVTQCAKPWPTTCWGDIHKAETLIRERLPGRLDAVYRAIDRTALRAPRRIAMGYPLLFGGKQCGGAARISPGEQKRLNDAGNLLDEVIARAARRRGFIFADPRPAFRGSAVCDRPEWINGISRPRMESFHPNRDGHAIYTALLQALS